MDYRRISTAGHGKDLYLRKRIAGLSYDPDCGIKTSLSTSMEHSAQVYSSLRSETDRFGNNRPTAAGVRALGGGCLCCGSVLDRLTRRRLELVCGALFFCCVRS